MALPAIVIIAGVAIALAATRRPKAKLPILLSEDCSTILWADKIRDVIAWQNKRMARHPPPPAPSDPDTLRDWIAAFVAAVMKEATPHCTYLFDVPLVEWPSGARYLFERLVYSMAITLYDRGYNVIVPRLPVGP